MHYCLTPNRFNFHMQFVCLSSFALPFIVVQLFFSGLENYNGNLSHFEKSNQSELIVSSVQPNVFHLLLFIKFRISNCHSSILI
jgi:hypothetical protein